MLGGKSVVMAGVQLRGDLQRIPEQVEGEPAKPPPTAITIGKLVHLVLFLTNPRPFVKC